MTNPQSSLLKHRQPVGMRWTADRPAMTDSQFELIRDIAQRYAGLALSDVKRFTVLRRVGKRMKSLSLPSVNAYCALLADRRGRSEVQLLINALTTNKTQFFRDPDQFAHLREVGMPQALASKRRQPGAVKLWSAGCSTGEEAWSMAMVCANIVAHRRNACARILASDVDTDVLAEASRARYRNVDCGSIEPGLRGRFMRPVGDGEHEMTIMDNLRRMVAFRQFNLHGTWPFSRPMDIIFCRNVVIYFDKAAQCALLDRLADALVPGGFLYSGRSECIYGVSKKLQSCGRGIYMRTA